MVDTLYRLLRPLWREVPWERSYKVADRFFTASLVFQSVGILLGGGTAFALLSISRASWPLGIATVFCLGASWACYQLYRKCRWAKPDEWEK